MPQPAALILLSKSPTCRHSSATRPRTELRADGHGGLRGVAALAGGWSAEGRCGKTGRPHDPARQHPQRRRQNPSAREVCAASVAVHLHSMRGGGGTQAWKRARDSCGGSKGTAARRRPGLTGPLRSCSTALPAARCQHPLYQRRRHSRVRQPGPLTSAGHEGHHRQTLCASSTATSRRRGFGIMRNSRPQDSSRRMRSRTHAVQCG